MAYLPPVVARLSMDLADFDAKIDEAKAKIRSLAGTETVRIRTTTDSGSRGSALSDLEKIAREADRINRSQKATMSLKLADGTRTWEELIAVDRMMARLNGKTARVKVKVDKGGFLNDMKSMFSDIGGSLGGGHSFNLPFTNMTANPIGLAAIGGAIAALLPELAGLLSGFTAAGAGAVAFGALAYPAVKKVETAYSSLKAAQVAYNAAQEKEKIDPSKANQAALTRAADNLKVVQRQISQMPAAEQAAIVGISNLSAAFGKASRAFEPKVFQVFSSGLRLVADLLPHLTPFANTFADGLSKIFSNLDKSSKSKGFQDFIKQFHGIEGPALQAIGAGIGNVAGSIGRLLTVMSGKDVAHSINIAFSAISGTIGGITTSIKFLMNAFDGMKLFGHNIASSFDQARHEIAAIFSGIGHDMTNGVKGAISFYQGIPGKIKGIFSGAIGWLVSAGQNVITGFVKGAKETWSAVSSWFSGLNAKVTTFFSGAGSWLVSAGEAIMGGLLHGIESAWGKVAGFLSSLAGKIKSLKGPLDYDRVMLFPHGQAIMQGLMGGMQSKVPALESQLKGITNTISNTAGHAANGGGAPIHVHISLDGRQIYSAVADRSVATQRRTGHNGMTKRTR